MAAPQPHLTDAAFKGALLNVLNRIAVALEKNQTGAAAPVVSDSPDYQRALGDFAEFDWEGIGARVTATDDDGPTEVWWNDAIFRRRAPGNKYGNDIWFSRYAGEDGDGNKQYKWLISFKEAAEIDPLPKKTRQAAVEEMSKAAQIIEGHPRPAISSGSSARPALPAPIASLAAELAETLKGDLGDAPPPPPADPPTSAPAQVTLNEDDITTIHDAARPSACATIFRASAPKGYNPKLLAEIVRRFKLDQQVAGNLWKRFNPNYTATLREFDRLVR